MRLSVILSLTLHIIFISLLCYTYEKHNNYENKDIELTVANFFTETEKNNISKTLLLNERKIKSENIEHKHKQENNNEDYIYKENRDFQKEVNAETTSLTSNENEDINTYIKYIETGIINGVVLAIPPYPAAAKKKGISGKSVIDIFIDENGKIISADIFLSSGYRVLDNAARETILKRWHLPAPGKKIVVRKIFDFELID